MLDSEATRARADQGDVDAQFALGLKYGPAGGEFQDLVQSAEWYRKASEQNHPLAQFNLGLMYVQGVGVKKNLVESYAWFTLASRSGSKFSERSSTVPARFKD